jgi:GT2 family glycosyltransferase
MKGGATGPKVFVIILNWNLPGDTIDCLRSVLETSYPLLEVVVVDNASSDNSVDRIRKRFPQMPLIQSGENLGYAGGNNLGIRYALEKNADYILLLNNDTLVQKSLIDHLVDFSLEQPSIGILGPAIYYYHPAQRFWRLGARYGWAGPIPLEIGRDALDRNQFSDPFQVDYVTGCAMWVRSELFMKLGLLDDTFFMYYEDADFCHRARQAGYAIYVVPRAKMWHKVSGTSGKEKGIALYYQARNRLIFYNRINKGFNRFMANAFLLISALRNTSRMWNRRSLIRDYWSGMRDGWVLNRTGKRPGRRP